MANQLYKVNLILVLAKLLKWKQGPVTTSALHLITTEHEFDLTMRGEIWPR